MKIWFLISIFFTILGCISPGAYIEESDISLTETRKAIVRLYGEPRMLSQNGREIYTAYMDKKGRVLESAKKLAERRHAHIAILGERRPYEIRVNVVIEAQAPDQTYEVVDTDDALSEQIATTLRSELLKSLENRNIIDDFNAF